MLLPYTTHIYYGQSAGAMIDTAPVVLVSASIKGDKRLLASIQGGLIQPFIKGTMGRKQTLSVQGIGELVQANWKKNGRVAMSVSIGATPSAYDIAQAVWGQVAVSVNIPGTTGEKLNGAGSSGDPWTDPRALTVGKFLGLK